jgi:N-acetylglutamate synthase-like GNAT family acetyltransferase
MNYLIEDGFDKMDFNRITDLLKNAFWCKGIKREEIIQGCRNSALLVGSFLPDSTRIGFSRVISDKTRFAYILDVIVDERYRNKGIGQSMIKYILENPNLKDVYQWTLITKDAHGVYKKSGFNNIARPNDWMEIRLERPNR